MKSKTSSFKTIFFKDITRFAPVWVLYLIGGLLIMGSVMLNNLSDSQYHARGLAESIGGLSILNLLYAPVYYDILPLSLEEIFIYELGGVNYEVKNIVL